MNVKPGDLAIIRMPHASKHNGLIVNVIRLVDDVLNPGNVSGPYWRIEAHALGQPPVGNGWCCADAHLRPISGLPLDEDVEHVEDMAA